MALVMMTDDKNKKKDAGEDPKFHDFLGMTSHEPHQPTDNMSSERLGMNSPKIFHFHGTKNAISGSETSNILSGRKRDYSSSIMGLIKDRMLPTGPDSPESSRFMKLFGKDTANEPFTMQPPPRPTSSVILHPPVSSRLDFSRWERSLPMNPGSVTHFPSRFGHIGTNMERVSSSYAYRDANMSATLISQDAADEGSRTGKKGSGILNIINQSSSGAGDKNITGMPMCSTSRPKAPQMVEPESSMLPSRYNMEPSTRQMTIFYAGRAHVFDDVHPNKADVIMALAGSNGGSWSTTYSPKTVVPLPGTEPKATQAETKSSLTVPEIQDHGFLSQVARSALARDLPSLTPSVDEGGRPVRDARLSTSAAAETDTNAKRDV